jgi:multiple antibiotic resistance protein
MLTSVLLSSTIGMENVAVAGIGACLASYLILRACGFINKMIGANGVEILSRIMGVLLAAFAVEYIRRGLGL